MAPYSIFSILLSLALSFSITDANVNETCTAMATGNFTIDYDFCITSLSLDPETKSADAHGLALIAAKLSLANATSTKKKIDGLATNSSDSTVKTVLGLCSSSYSNLIPELTISVHAIRGGDYAGAVSKIDRVKDMPLDCEDMFFEGGKESPVAKEDNDLVELMTLALAITVSLV